MVERFDSLKVKDQLGRPDTLAIFGPFRKTETIIIEEHPTVIFTYDFTDVPRWGEDYIFGTYDDCILFLDLESNPE
jgi:hypothetical protein